MCLVLFAWRAHRAYPLILAANRDEFHARPTATAEFWQDDRSVLGGRDLQDGGTWLGLTRGGRFAAVTNYREPLVLQDAKRSRGALVREFLQGDAAPSDYAAKILAEGGDYAGFSLLVGDMQDLYWVSNRHDAPRAVEPGVHGLSNRDLDAPWPKVRRGVNGLQRCLPEDNRAGVAVEPLMDLLVDRTVPADDHLPDTGVGVELERILSPAFILGSEYGTRSSTVLVVDHEDGVNFVECTFNPLGTPVKSRGYAFSLRR